jgi:hypothetical protein
MFLETDPEARYDKEIFPFLTTYHFIYFQWLQQRGTQLVHNCHNWKPTAGRKKYPHRLQPRTQLIHGRYMKTDSGTQLVNSAD